MKIPVSPRLIVVVPALVLATTGCDSNSKPEPCTTFPVVEERVKASEFDGIDLLVVIDTSATAEQQSALAQGVYSISNVLTMPLQSEFPPVESLRLAVVSSDMGLQWGGGEVGGSSADISGCDNNRGRNGELLTITAKSITLNGGVIPCEPDGGQCPAGFSCDDGFCTPDGAVGYAPCDVFSGPAEMVDSTLEPTSEISTHLACLATQENEGCGLEQPLEAAVRAIETHPELISPNHLLGVLIIAPDDDCSIENPELFETPEWNDDFAIAYACFYPEENQEYLFDPFRYYEKLVALKEDNPKAVVFSAIAGVPAGSNSPCQGDGEWIQFAGCLDDDSMQTEVETYVTESGAIYEAVAQACATGEDWEDAVWVGRPGRRLVEVAQLFGPNGYVHSICDASWRPAALNMAAALFYGRRNACLNDRLLWQRLNAQKANELGCDECGTVDCTVLLEVVRTGDDFADESCPAGLYEGLSQAEAREYTQQRSVKVDGDKKMVSCPIPKLPSPLDCRMADYFVIDAFDPGQAGWYYCETYGESFDDVCDDQLDNDWDGSTDCEDAECMDCVVCGGTGINCEAGCQYGIELTDGANRVLTGWELVIQCVRPTVADRDTCKELNRDGCNNGIDDNENGVWDCDTTIFDPDARVPHWADPDCCPMTKNKDNICVVNENQVKTFCPRTERTASEGISAWSWIDVGACQEQMRRLGCVPPSP